MLEALNILAADFQFDVKVIDVDADEKLLAQYDELVPVLVGKRSGDSEWTKLCHYFLDAHIVSDFLRGH